jgi:hypothetical protein
MYLPVPLPPGPPVRAQIAATPTITEKESAPRSSFVGTESRLNTTFELPSTGGISGDGLGPPGMFITMFVNMLVNMYLEHGRFRESDRRASDEQVLHALAQRRFNFPASCRRHRRSVN